MRTVHVKWVGVSGTSLHERSLYFYFQISLLYACAVGNMGCCGSHTGYCPIDHRDVETDL